jgi:hypothetical protein
MIKRAITLAMKITGVGVFASGVNNDTIVLNTMERTKNRLESPYIVPGEQ